MTRRTALVLLVVAAAIGATTAAATRDSAHTVSLRLSDRTVRFGADLAASGRIAPALEGAEIVLEQRRDRNWMAVRTTRTDPGGSFSVRFAPLRAGPLRARLADEGAVSAAADVGVRPVVRLEPRVGRAFLGARLDVRVRPRSSAAGVRATVRKRGHRVATVAGRLTRGRARLEIPTPGVGRFGVRVELAAAHGLDRVSKTTRVRANVRTLAYRSTGRDVRALVERLAELRVRTPPATRMFGAEVIDAVLAFQKLRGLPRDGVVNVDMWRELARATVPRPRYSGRRPHIEVDKTRQILMVVKGGAVRTVVSASTGATGNTPEGTFTIRWKAPWTTTWLGPAILYRTMTFYGDNFAIHGYPEVPAYPASHGCVRIPMWVADWLYRRSPVGERVYVYS